MNKVIVIFIAFITSCTQSNNNNFDIIDNKSIDEVNDSIYKEYYESGQLKIKVKIIDGLQDDTLFEYHDNGQLKRLQTWNNGDPIGFHKVFDKDGNILYDEESFYKYENHDSIKSYSIYNSDTSSKIKINDRVIFKNMESLNKSIIITPKKEVKFGIENIIGIQIPNMRIVKILVNDKYATISKKGSGIYYSIFPKQKERNILVYITTEINDTTIEFDPIEFKMVK